MSKFEKINQNATHYISEHRTAFLLFFDCESKLCHYILGRFLSVMMEPTFFAFTILVTKERIISFTLESLNKVLGDGSYCEICGFRSINVEPDGDKLFYIRCFK